MPSQMTPEVEAKAAAHRAKNRQNKVNPWLIREDGMIYPNVPLIAKRQGFMIYRGDINAPLEERMQYLQGLSPRRRVITSAPPVEEPFDISKASRDELIMFALDEFSETLDPDMPVPKMRAAIAVLAGLPPDQVAAVEAAPDDEDPQPQPAAAAKGTRRRTAAAGLQQQG